MEHQEDRFMTQLERLFWQKAISVLSSGNKMVAATVRVGAYFMPRVGHANLVLKTVFWACIGLSIGLGIGVLIG